MTLIRDVHVKARIKIIFQFNGLVHYGDYQKATLVGAE